MNCRHARRLLSAGRDAALENQARVALDAHLASCPACREMQAAFAASAQRLRTASANVRVPDAELAWQAIRREIRGGSAPGRASRQTRRTGFWISGAVAAAAAVVLAVFVAPRWTRSTGSEVTARADPVHAEYIEVADRGATPVVFVDEESGWLVVWTVPDNGTIVN